MDELQDINYYIEEVRKEYDDQGLPNQPLSNLTTLKNKSHF
jgi:hypothetical protein